MRQPTLALYLFNVAIFILLVVMSFGPLYRGRLNKVAIKNRNSSIFASTSFLLLLLFLVFQYTESDFWSYWGLFERGDELVEPLQNWIRDHFNNYYLWRLTVWGSALAITIWAFKRLGLNPRIYYPIFVLCYLTRFISREQLGIAIMFLGSTFILNPTKNKSLSFILGVALIMGSYYFHNSMVVSIAMLFPALFKITTRRAMLIIILFVPLIYLFIYVMGNESIMQFFTDTSTNTGDRIAIYTEWETERMNTLGLLRQLLYWSPMILMLADVIMRSSGARKTIELPNSIQFYLNYWFLMFIISFVFYWIITRTTLVSVRLLDKSLFPMVIVLSYWYSVNKPSSIMKVSLILFLLYDLFNYSLIIYKAI